MNASRRGGHLFPRPFKPAHRGNTQPAANGVIPGCLIGDGEGFKRQGDAGSGIRIAPRHNRGSLHDRGIRFVRVGHNGVSVRACDRLGNLGIGDGGCLRGGTHGEKRGRDSRGDSFSSEVMSLCVSHDHPRFCYRRFLCLNCVPRLAESLRGLRSSHFGFRFNRSSCLFLFCLQVDN